MTTAISYYAWNRFRRNLRDATKRYEATRADALVARQAWIASGRGKGSTRLAREDATGAAIEARYDLNTLRRHFAQFHPEKAPGWSINARNRRCRDNASELHAVIDDTDEPCSCLGGVHRPGGCEGTGA